MFDDLEEIPVGGTKKSFEELLEEKMREEMYMPVQRREVPKKEFLRRKSNPPAEYVVGKYEELEDKPTNTKNVLDKYLKPKEPEQKPLIPKMKKPSPSVQIDYPQSSTPEPCGKKSFLKRGEGKSCLTKKELKPKKKVPTKPYQDPSPRQNIDSIPVVIKESKPIRARDPVEEPKKPTQIVQKPKEETIYYDPTVLNSASIDPPKDPKPNKTAEIYNEKMNELNAQVERFRQQALSLKAENKEIKAQIAAVDLELSEFTERKTRRMQELQNLKENEFKRMKKERLEIEKNMKNVEYRKSEEVEEMRLLLFKTQEEFTIKDYKEKENLERLTDELSKLNTDITELETQVKIREQVMLKDKFSKPTTKNPSEKVYQNGTRVKNYPDGKKVIYFTNGDVKETHPDGKVIYMYNEDQITEITLPDGTSICEFSNGQTEKTYPNGVREIIFPDGTSQKIYKS